MLSKLRESVQRDFINAIGWVVALIALTFLIGMSVGVAVEHAEICGQVECPEPEPQPLYDEHGCATSGMMLEICLSRFFDWLNENADWFYPAAFRLWLVLVSILVAVVATRSVVNWEIRRRKATDDVTEA